MYVQLPHQTLILCIIQSCRIYTLPNLAKVRNNSIDVVSITYRLRGLLHNSRAVVGTLIGLQNPASWKTHPVILAKARKTENSKPGYLDNLKLEFHNSFL